MADLVWVLDSKKGFSFGNAGVSGSYILPKNEVPFDPKILAGRRLWVMLRGHEDRLFQFLKIKRVERILDEYYSGDYLVSPETTGSVKLVSGYADAAKYSISGTETLKLGVSELSPSISEKFYALVKRSVQTKLLPPDVRLLANVDFQLLPHSTRRLAQSALCTVLSRLTLDQVWASSNGNKLGAFSNFAYAMISEKTGAKPEAGLVEALKDFDPVSIILSEGKATPESGAYSNKSKTPCVDMEFSEIDPGKIYARQFVSVDPSLRGMEDALNKTEHAEKLHQSMLKDISEFLLSKGITPYESGSIDLIYRSGDRLNVFEIKSSNVENLLSQAAKGAFQLACYLNELSNDYDGLSAQLVLHETSNPELQNYAEKALSRLGVKVLVYDPGKPWPSRLQGMLL